MSKIDLTTPLPACVFAPSDHRRAYARENARPGGYETRLSAIAEAWDVAPGDLLRPEYVEARDAVQKIEDEINEYAPVPLPDVEVLRGKNDAGRRKIINDTRSENEYRAQVRKALTADRDGATAVLEGVKAPELTYDYVMRVLPVVETAARVRKLANYLGNFTNAQAISTGLLTGSDLRIAEAANKVLPEFRAGLNRLLMIDYLIPDPSEGFALYTDPGIKGLLNYRFNMSDRGDIIGVVNDWTDSDLVAHRVAKDFREAFLGGFTDRADGRRRLSATNQFSAIGSGDRAVTPLARGLVGDLVLDIAPSWDVFQDRLDRFEKADRKAEDREGRFSADVFKDSETHVLNRETDEYEKFVYRTNLRTGEVKCIRVGDTVPEPNIRRRVDPVRN
ncbi:hypothetical protein [Corynebacterium neomassiliense]|uniref:hypothetical protein n=1 Tax=Corynebacterium neomassiliense TaxID=2079482 RepID=UPI00102FD709|nr:hypothetical protein [Corynebacterium neomassiliense]